MIINLGVADMPYGGGGKTTGDVAEILEGKYDVMQHFYDLHQADIVAALQESVVGAFESVIMGRKLQSAADPHDAGTSAVVAMFKKFLSEREMDSLGVPGVPTRAALMGISSRFKNPNWKRAPKNGRAGVRRPPRPSFVDTGLYEASFECWVEE